MENRKLKDVGEIVDFVLDKWQLSINEEEVLDSFLNLFAENKTEKIKQIEHLINDEIASLLGRLNDREVIEYCSEELGMISSDDEDDLVQALDDLIYNWIEKVDEDEMINYLEESGYVISDDSNIPQNIVEESQFEEWRELFNSLSFQEREDILKGRYNG